MENALKSCKYTALPCVYARSSMSYAIALVCTTAPLIEALAAELGSLEGVGFEALCKEPRVVSHVMGELVAACKAANLNKFEIPAKCILVSEIWTPDNGMLTAVNKLKRKDIEARHLAEIDAIYV